MSVAGSTYCLPPTSFRLLLTAFCLLPTGCRFPLIPQVHQRRHAGEPADGGQDGKRALPAVGYRNPTHAAARGDRAQITDAVDNAGGGGAAVLAAKIQGDGAG